jgi:hypothetical protein
VESFVPPGESRLRPNGGVVLALHAPVLGNFGGAAPPSWYPGVIVAADGTPAYDVRFDDGDFGPAMHASMVQASSLPLPAAAAVPVEAEAAPVAAAPTAALADLPPPPPAAAPPAPPPAPPL